MTYHPQVFTCKFASYHLALIEMMELAIHEGGWFAMAVPRGGGKSTLAEVACEWAVLHGHKAWPVLIGATSDKATKRLKNVKTELRTNDYLLEDFPEVCLPIGKLGRSARKAEGQMAGGAPTAIEWGMNQIALPTIADHVYEPWAAESFDQHDIPRPPAPFGSRITALGLTGDIRGLSEKTEQLRSIRPDLAIPDDPQTRESAKSYLQSQNRAATIAGDIAYLNGPSSKMSVIMPATVIYQGDMVDQMLDRNLNPEWRGERHQMVERFPDSTEHWDRYAEIRRECNRLGKSMDAANQYYMQHRDEMDRGAVVSWPDRHAEDELSAIQHAMNAKIRDEASFWAEYQNKPVVDAESEAICAGPLQIIAKQNHCPRGLYPDYVTHLAAGIDVQQRILYYTVAGASKTLQTAIQDYGTVPDQKRSYFGYREDGLKTIDQVFPDDSPPNQIYKAILGTIHQLATARYVREDGAELTMGRILVDCGFFPEAVISACRDSEFSAIVTPSKGFGVQAKDTPWGLRAKKKGEVKGHGWIEKPKPDNKAVLYVQMDANMWKTQLHSSLLATTGDGSVSLWKDRPERHRMFAEHLNGEFPTRVKAKDNEVDEWKERPERPDNHFFDTAYAAMVGLSMQGCAIPNVHETHRTRRKRRVLSKKTIEARNV